MIEQYATKGRLRLRLRAYGMGRDIVVLVDGGDAPHIGATALATPTGDAQSQSLPHHREDELALHLSSTLAQKLGRTVAVLCGIHVANISPQEIADVYILANTLAAECIAQYTRIERT